MADFATKAEEVKPKAEEEPKGDEKAGDEGGDDEAVVEVNIRCFYF